MLRKSAAVGFLLPCENRERSGRNFSQCLSPSAVALNGTHRKRSNCARSMRLVEGMDASLFFDRRFVTRFGFAVVIELAAGPEQAARDQRQITFVRNRFIVVTDGCAEDARMAVLVEPCDNI